MMNRRRFLTRSVQASLATATAAFWGNSLASRAFAQSVGSTYKAIVVITLNGGNDANNLLVPLDPAEYAEYSQMRGSLALPISSLIALNSASGAPTYGVHPSLTNVAALYNSGRALAVAGVGPMVQPATKAAIDRLGRSNRRSDCAAIRVSSAGPQCRTEQHLHIRQYGAGHCSTRRQPLLSAATRP